MSRVVHVVDREFSFRYRVTLEGKVHMVTTNQVVAADNKNILDAVIENAAKVQKAISIISPQVGLGIELVKALLGIINRKRTENGQPEVPVPSDPELIALMRARFVEVEHDGEDALARWGLSNPAAPPVG
jgi:hypothetical protein